MRVGSPAASEHPRPSGAATVFRRSNAAHSIMIYRVATSASIRLATASSSGKCSTSTFQTIASLTE
jgi:hypothetical protein